MRVYRIENDVNHFQYFLPQKSEDVFTLLMDCTSKATNWISPPVYIYKPRHKAGDFYNFDWNSVITSPRATAALHSHLIEAGELLPLFYQDDQFAVLNVLQCVDCLDHSLSERQPGHYTKYVFRSNQLAQVQSTIFKIPQTRQSEVLVVEGLKAPEEEFRYTVEKSGLKGLLFTELWLDD
jgi:hypothetical protein